MSDKPKVILTPYPRLMSEIFANSDLARLQDMADVVWGQDEAIPATVFEAALPEAVVILHGRWSFGGAETLEKAHRLRAVIEVSGGHHHTGFAYDYSLAHRIRVLSCSPAFAPQVAEMALGMAIASAREIVLGDRVFRAGDERYSKAGNASTFMLYGQPVGFVGFGALARSLKRLLDPFRCTVSVYDPWLPASLIRAEGCKPVGLEELLVGSRYIFVLAVPTPENKGLLSRPLLEKIQPGSVFALISRAHLVDFDALTDLVLAGRFRAAIDVFPQEPLPADHPIRRAEGAVLSAHRAGSVREGLHEIGRMAVDDMEMILAGLPPRFMLEAQPELISRLRPNFR